MTNPNRPAPEQQAVAKPETRDAPAFGRLFEGVQLPPPSEPVDPELFTRAMALFAPAPPAPPAEPGPAEIAAALLRDRGREGAMLVQKALADALLRTRPAPATPAQQGRTEKWFSPAPAGPGPAAPLPEAKAPTRPGTNGHASPTTTGRKRVRRPPRAKLH